jgi:hypothetical protein
VPYSDADVSNPAALAVQVVHRGLRPEPPSGMPPALAAIMRACWASDPTERPTAHDVLIGLREVLCGLRLASVSSSFDSSAYAGTPAGVQKADF